jgi:hypothetical protein
VIPDVTKPGPEALARVHELAERVLTREEYEALASVAIDADERAEKLALIEWFTRRYPTPAERLAYVRRAYSTWTRGAQ